MLAMWLMIWWTAMLMGLVGFVLGKSVGFDRLRALCALAGPAAVVYVALNVISDRGAETVTESLAAYAVGLSTGAPLLCLLVGLVVGMAVERRQGMHGGQD